MVHNLCNTAQIVARVVHILICLHNVKTDKVCKVVGVQRYSYLEYRDIALAGNMITAVRTEPQLPSTFTRIWLTPLGSIFEKGFPREELPIQS